MIVTLDSERLEQDFATGCTLEQVLEQVRDTLADDRLIVSVAVNGELCSESDLESILNQPLQVRDQVDLESSNRFEVATVALREVAAQLGAAGDVQVGIAKRLNSGEVAEAIREVGEHIGVWQTCRQVVVQCSGLLNRDLTKEDYDGQPVEQHLSELIDRLREIRDALEAQDMVLLADMLHYEMPSLCATWQSILLCLADRIGAGATDTASF